MSEQPIYAAFDLDGTLFNGDCAELWLQFLRDQNWPGITPTIANCQQLMTQYDSGELDMLSYMTAWLKPLVGYSLLDVKALAQQFYASYVQHFYSQGIERVKWHQQQGHTTICISASPDFVVQAITNFLGFEHILGIEVELDEQKITGRVALPLCFQQGKTQLLEQRFGSQLDYSYSDSINDVSLLDMAQSAYVVNPNRQLQALATQKGWQILHWQG
ncbi:HAD family hydrolase [Paraglaciecola sp.]|uniref:HAD family hydrolase n=1 Tax=Paraglaciecola sp. TaxID=1920173 RepID=UPI0030F45F81